MNGLTKTRAIASSRESLDRAKTNIASVVNNRLCTGCGTCAGICPSLAIKMNLDEENATYAANIIEKKCSHCGTCSTVCPGFSLDFAQLNSSVFGRPQRDYSLGNYLRCYTGNASEHEIRYNSSSGGLITSLLIAALEDGTIDGALVTRMAKNTPLLPEPFIARTKADVISAQGSKYCPVPTNAMLRTILSERAKFAVVGLPCQIHGIRKAEIALPKLRERVVLHLGLFCSHNVNFQGTEYFLGRLHVEKDDVSVMRYRGDGWPGSASVKLKDGARKTDLEEIWNNMFISRFFTPMYCMFCRDSTNEFADISFGDPWLPRFRNEKIGKSIVICRNQKGLGMLYRATSKRLIELTSISHVEVNMSQKSLSYKKRIVNVTEKVTHKRYTSHKNAASKQGKLLDYFVSILFLLNIQASSHRCIWGILGIWSQMMKVLRRFSGF